MRRSATELRGQILDAARAEFARHGLAGSRIDRIAREAHASKERLYAHFGDKEALFREVVDTDVAAFYRSVTLRPDAVPEFAGDVYDLGRNSPEHLRMITWARLEGLALDEPPADGQAIFQHAVTAIETAQTDGHIDSSWDPLDLLALLFGIGLAWAHSPDPYESLTDRAVIARQRRAAVEAARRIVSAPCG
ncbi:TetR family transcriptional regulator [Mycolicibacter heraklionensis]|uniref:TetR family transcriptional regulator n=1 Tax=Mycolicibacter heraklionensis TaxID=512402 RepID=UPI0007EA6743|nr:TetR family transcriptional regulator [Mycolicibacter heraklionensis]OBG40809.1 TetR family transcriptional regulator [Mycolicibacter heraklionensis]